MVIKDATPSIFADDTGLMATSESFPNLENLIEEDIQSLVSWLANNTLTLNVLKTEFLIVGSKARLSRLEDDLYISAEGESIYRSPYHKSLGFVIDESIDWEDHITQFYRRKGGGRARGAPPPPPPIIFERYILSQQIMYCWKGNLTGNRIHLKCWKKILISRFYEQFSRNGSAMAQERLFEKISNF